MKNNTSSTGGPTGAKGENKPKRVKSPFSTGKLKDLRADRLVYRPGKDSVLVILEGNVKIAGPGLYLYADYGEAHQTPSGQIVFGFAKGNVRVFLEDQTMIRGERLDYDPKEEKAVMTSGKGNPRPRVWRGGYLARADQILYFFKRKKGERTELSGNVNIVPAKLPKEYFEVFPAKGARSNTPGTGATVDGHATTRP